MKKHENTLKINEYIKFANISVQKKLSKDDQYLKSTYRCQISNKIGHNYVSFIILKIKDQKLKCDLFQDTLNTLEE